jgi:transcriptional regulator with XRE-family HTH domain
VLPFPKLLKVFRIEAGVSQRELADKIELHVSHLSKIETGRSSPPKRDKVLAMAKVLKLGPDQTDKLLLTAGYSPMNISPQMSEEEEVTSKSFGAPLTKKDLKKLLDIQEDQKSSESFTADRLIKLISTIRRDPEISESSKRTIEEQIYAFAEWTYQKAKDRKRRPPAD